MQLILLLDRLRKTKWQFYLTVVLEFNPGITGKVGSYHTLRCLNYGMGRDCFVGGVNQTWRRNL